MKLSWITPKPTKSFIPKLRRQASQRVIDIATAVWQGAVDRTPTRSGELRASWNLTPGRPSFESVGNPDSAPDVTTALPKPVAPVLKPTVLLQAKYFISNGKSYARYVEFGSSSISPHLMLTRSVRAVEL